MIKTLRKKFIAVSMISVVVVLTLLIGLINYMNYRNIVSEADETLKVIADSGGIMPEKPMDRPDRKAGDRGTDHKTDAGDGADADDRNGAGDRTDAGRPMKGIADHRRAEMFFDTRYFTVTFDGNGEIVSSDTDRIAAIGQAEAKDIAEKIYRSGRTKGFSGNYRYLKANMDSEADAAAGYDMIICVDCYRGLGNLRSFLLYSILVSIAGLILVFMLVVVLSGKVVKPVAESYEKQKRFITDAGHELKTPLTVIDADISVIEMEGGKSEWLSDIKQQTKRLAGLTNELVYLSKMDEGRSMESIEFPLSDVAAEEVQSFAARAKVEGKELTAEIDPGMSYTGDQKMISELISILMDNAVKYSSDGGSIDVKLRRSGTGADLIVSNDVDSITKEQTEKMFDRFYRADESRSEKAGYGLGLSIAEAVCKEHGGSIKAEPIDNGKRIRITARLA